MESTFQRWWLYACFAAVLLAGWAGGFGVIFMLVFITIYLVGVVLIGPDDEPAEPEDTAAAGETDFSASPTAEPEPSTTAGAGDDA